jgi:tRNA pseudouridine55 synthase
VTQKIQTNRREAATGVLLVDKPQGLTSHDVVGRVRRIFGQREVGHTGTLDPMATGLLILALGRATRIARFIESQAKRYTGTVRLGRATTTFDAEGDTTATAELGLIERSAIDRALASLTGEIEQRPPAFSAIKVGGERLYAKARRGEEVEAPVRTISIHALALLEVALPDLVIDVRCSKGTYIRSLAVQIGDALGVPAHLAALRRTEIGSHRVETAKSLDALAGDPSELIPIEAALLELPALHLDGPLTADVRHGRPLKAGAVRARVHDRFSAGAELRLVAEGGEVLAVGIAELGSGELQVAEDQKRAVSYACVLTPPISHA